MDKDKLPELQEQYEDLCKKVNDIQADFTTTNSELTEVDQQIMDAQATERTKLIQRRGALVNQKDALNKALNGLIARRDLAHLAIYEYQEEILDQAHKKQYEAYQKKVRELNSTELELRIIRNKRPADISQPEYDKKTINLEVSVARLRVEVKFADRDTFQARTALERARGETGRIQNELTQNSTFSDSR